MHGSSEGRFQKRIEGGGGLNSNVKTCHLLGALTLNFLNTYLMGLRTS